MVLGGSWISHAREKALLGNVNTWANSDLLAVDIINQFTSGSSDVASGYNFHGNLYILLF